MSNPFIDADCQKALDTLNNKIIEFERLTGRKYTLILIPGMPGEDIFVSLDGRPSDLLNVISPEEFLQRALQERKKICG